MNRTYSLDTLPQEYPTLGTGDFRNIALDIKTNRALRVLSFFIRVMKSETENTL